MELALPAVHQTGGGRLRTGPDLATEGTEFTERFIPLSSTRQAGCFRWETSVLSVDLCGKTFLTRVRQKRAMAKQARGRGRYRYRYRMAVGGDSDMRNRIVAVLTQLGSEV